MATTIEHELVPKSKHTFHYLHLQAVPHRTWYFLEADIVNKNKILRTKKEKKDLRKKHPGLEPSSSQMDTTGYPCTHLTEGGKASLILKTHTSGESTSWWSLAVQK